MSDTPSNVIAAIAAVQGRIGKIDKKTPRQRGSNEKGVPYAYRGIEEIAGAAQPLFAEYGIVIVPIADDSLAVDDITVGGKPWTANLVRFQWRVYGPGGAEDFIDAATWGLGFDNSDKGVNKASTQAYKNLLLRLLTIGDPADEGEHSRPEREAKPAVPRNPRADAAALALKELSDEDKDTLRDAVEAEFGRPLVLAELPTDEALLVFVELCLAVPVAPAQKEDQP